VQRTADPDANIIFGAVLNEAMGEEVKITVIATGFRSENFGVSQKMSDAAAAAAAEVRPALREAFRLRERSAPAPEQQPAAARAERTQPDEEAAPAAVRAGGADPDDIEKPAYLRRRAAQE
jgi:cell division protein FtsZ